MALKRIGVEENPKRRKHPGVKHNCCQLCVPIVFYWIFQARISGLDSCCRSIFPKGETPTGLNTAFAFTKNKETQLGGGMPGGTARVLCFWGSPKTRLPLNKIHSVNKVTRQREVFCTAAHRVGGSNPALCRCVLDKKLHPGLPSMGWPAPYMAAAPIAVKSTLEHNKSLLLVT